MSTANRLKKHANIRALSPGSHLINGKHANGAVETPFRAGCPSPPLLGFISWVLALALDQHLERLAHGGMKQLVHRIPLGAVLAGVPGDDVGNLNFADLQ